MATKSLMPSMFGLALFATSVAGNAFLEPSDSVTINQLESIFLSELLDPKRSVELVSVEEQMRPLFASLPKTDAGKLDASTARYALHRYFVQQHGWFMKGLNGETGSLNSTAGSMMKDFAPSYIQGLLDQQLQGAGLGIHELAAFAATLADVVHREVAGDLHKVFTSLALPMEESMPRHQADYAAKAFMITYFGNKFSNNKNGWVKLEKRLERIYPGWFDTLMWSQDLRSSHDILRSDRRNPFVDQKETFDDTFAYTKEFVHRLGPFQNNECHLLKQRLLDMEVGGTGRVPLSVFYVDGVTRNGKMLMMESPDYLRSLGALDDNPAQPSVIIPNYMNSLANCVSHSGFYNLCCFNECEGLLRRLEEDIAAPSAAPARIVEVVSELSSDTVVAPRNMSSTLLSRLGEIASFHGGHVPLHGRMFSQWMHHAFPRECPFPQRSGTTTPLSQLDWRAKHGISSDASKDLMASYVYGPESDVELTYESLPWDFAEELVTEYKRPAETSNLNAFLRQCMALVALATMIVSLARASKALPDGNGEKYLV